MPESTDFPSMIKNAGLATENASSSAQILGGAGAREITGPATAGTGNLKCGPFDKGKYIVVAIGGTTPGVSQVSPFVYAQGDSSVTVNSDNDAIAPLRVGLNGGVLGYSGNDPIGTTLAWFPFRITGPENAYIAFEAIVASAVVRLSIMKVGDI